jgi:uncharacterized protein
MERIICEFKSSTSDEGYISGYGSIFGNIDSYGDIVAKGAFTKSIADVDAGSKAWPAMLLQHGGPPATDQTPIGVWTSMEEDDKGLKMTGRLAPTTRGKEALALLRMSPRPALSGLSIGYRCTDYAMHGKGNAARRTIKAADLIEVSLVTFPANSRATITGVKSAIVAPPAKPYTAADQVRDDWAMLCRTMNANNRDYR